MPPIRTMPTVKAVRTERTHEENQERAYIAASRRSDRSLEARVESARRASEIHKKRTGRSLRVREEDVMNEEMYEEEDDDLPMQFRRINALNPGFAFNGFTDRVNSYLAGQIGVRNYLHQAIYQANQNNQFNNHFFNPIMQQGFQNGTMSPQAMSGPFPAMSQPPYSQMGMQHMQPGQPQRSASIGTPAEFAKLQQQSHGATVKPSTPGVDESRRLSIPGQAGLPSPTTSHPRSAGNSQPPTPASLVSHQSASPKRVSASPHMAAHLPQGMRPSAPSPGTGASAFDQQMFPLTTKIPLETQQLMEGTAFAAYGVQSMPGGQRMGQYSYNPNGKRRDSSSNSPSGPQGLNQTLTQFPMGSQTTMTASSMSEPHSAMSAPANLDFSFNNDVYGMNNFGTSNYAFDMGFGSNHGTAPNSGHVTPVNENWNEADFFNYEG